MEHIERYRERQADVFRDRMRQKLYYNDRQTEKRINGYLNTLRDKKAERDRDKDRDRQMHKD